MRRLTRRTTGMEEEQERPDESHRMSRLTDTLCSYTYVVYR